LSEYAKTFKDKTILINGGAGAIGGNLTRILCNYDVKRIIVYDNLSSSYKCNIPKDPKVQFIKGDILDNEKLRWSARVTQLDGTGLSFAEIEK